MAARCVAAVGLCAGLAYGCSAASARPEGTQNRFYRDGRLIVGGAPSTADLERLRGEGVQTVIDLRQADQVSPDASAQARRLGMKYVHVPMKSDALTDAQARAFLDAMNAAEGPVLIYCASGNRAGGMYGLYLGATGVCSADNALQKARAAGLKNPHLTDDVRQYLQLHPPPSVPAAAR